jgi:proline iminopeptidase
MTLPSTGPTAATPPHERGTRRDVPAGSPAQWVRPTGAGAPFPWLAALSLATAYGVVAGVWTPRGPLTTSEALTAMLLSALVGLCVGLLTRSRWSAIVLPAVFLLVFELIRAGITGPTVDGVHLGNTYEIIAFVVGRGMHGLLALLPMIVFALLGAAMARRRSQLSLRHSGALAATGLWTRRGGLAVAIVSVAALALLIARPASTDPILDANGDPVADSVAELTRVDLGDHELALMIRGHSVDNPVLLFLAGGPGGSEFGAMRRHSEALEDDFVVATLDQRGTGTSYDQLDPTQSLTVDGSVEDVLAVADYLRSRFDQDKVYLVGQSWGTLLGVLAVQREPGQFHAFVGAGQMVNPLATDRIFYQDTLDWARETGNTDLVDTLTRSGPPPYTSMLDYVPALSHEQEVYPYDHSPNSEGSGQMSENLLVEEYTLLDQVHVLGAFMDTFSVLYPQLQDIDLLAQVPKLEVPVYLAQGRHEAPGRSTFASEWFEQLDAPSKRLVEFDTSGHRPLWEQPSEFHNLMTDIVLTEPETVR